MCSFKFLQLLEHFHIYRIVLSSLCFMQVLLSFSMAANFSYTCHIDTNVFIHTIFISTYVNGINLRPVEFNVIRKFRVKGMILCKRSRCLSFQNWKYVRFSLLALKSSFMRCFHVIQQLSIDSRLDKIWNWPFSFIYLFSFLCTLNKWFISSFQQFHINFRYEF